jgi:RNA polymerase sigma-70 factor (ECF subfamily)
VTKSGNAHLVPRADADRADYARLVRQAAAGDRAAMERLLIRAQEAAYRFSFLVCGHAEDAEDVMQDALLKTYRHVSQIKDPEAFRTWLYTTVRNTCLMKRRRHVDEPKRLVSIEGGEPDREGKVRAIDVEGRERPADQRMIDAWVGGRLRRALQALPPPYRMLVMLREMEGLSTRETARVAGISEANVKTRLHRARTMLRRELDGL